MPVPSDALPPVTLVDREDALARALPLVADEPMPALDTEFMRTNTFNGRLCLVQMAVAGEVFCVDELAGLDTTPLWNLLCADRGLRILHAPKQDLEVIFVRHGRLLGPLFDTQIGAALAGHPPQVGYATLVKSLLGVEVDKTHTRADWAQRPLAPALIAYAGADVAWLPEVYARLQARLTELGRYAWALEDSARLLDPALYTVNVDEAWRRLAAIPKLPVAAQWRARRLARWREETAIRSDRPRQWILSDRALLDMALRNPHSPEELAAGEDIAPGFVRRQGQVVLRELELAAQDAASGEELVQEARPESVDPAALKRLGQAVEARAKDLGIAPELLATRRDLTAIIRGDPDSRPLAGWRREIIGNTLATLAGG